MGSVYKGDVGTLITVDCGTDISAATTKQIEARLPNRKTATWAASLSGTNYLTYNLVDTDTATVGLLRAQSYVEIAGSKWHGETFSFEITERFK